MYEGEYCNQPPGHVTKVTLPPSLIVIRKIVGESIDAFAINNHFLTPTSSPTGGSISRKGTARATIMAKQTININRVDFYAPEANVILYFEGTIPNIVKDENTGAFVVGESNHINIKRSVLLAQVAELSTMFSDYLGVREEPMTKAGLSAVFNHAKIVIEHELKQPGELVGEYVVENQKFYDKVLDIEFSTDSVTGMKGKLAAAF